jgi:DNA-binding MarR family transcriptional regulator
MSATKSLQMNGVIESRSRKRASTWRRFRRHHLAVIGSAMLLIMVLCAVGAPVIAGESPTRTYVGSPRESPSSAHLLGTDDAGRDVLSRLLHAGRVSLSVGIVAVSIYTFIGIILGSAAGYFGGLVDSIVMRLADAFLAFPPLIRAALLHYQFEAIHPYLDGNGRIGRLLIAFLLHHGGVLSKPLLYLSLYFNQHRPEYYRLLDLVRAEGDWEAWLNFFLEGVEDTASNAVRTAQRLVKLFKEDTARVQSVGRTASSALHVFNALCERPITTLNDLCQRTGLSFPTTTKGMDRLMKAGVVKELISRRRNRVFAYEHYLAILNEGTEPL